MFSSVKLTTTNIASHCDNRPGSRQGVVGFLLLLILSVPLQAWAAYQPDLLVKLASEGNSAYLGGGVFEATAELQSKSQPAFPGTPALFDVLLKNAGDQPDSFKVQGIGSSAGAQVRFLDPDGSDRTAALTAGFVTPLLAPGESLVYRVQVTPVSFLLGASFRVSVEAASAAEPARLDQVKTETVACSSSAALTVSAPPDAFGPPGTVVNYPYTVTNVGNTSNSFTLSVATPAGWASAIYADDGAGGGVAGDAVRQAGETILAVSTGSLAPGASYRFFVAVSIPAGSKDGAHVDTRLFATGVGAAAMDQVTTSATTATVVVAENVRNLTQGGPFANSASAQPGDTLEYRMAVTNSGTLPATSVGVLSPVPANTVAVPGSLRIATSPTGDGSACAAGVCGSVHHSGSSIVAQLGEGTTESTGGTLFPGKTLYVFFRVQVE